MKSTTSTPTPAATPSLVDRTILRTGALAGYAVNNAAAAAAIVPIGYSTARGKHNLDARIAAARAYANTL